ncbi:MAG: hypothetical protein ACI92E_002824 [Oceanicoccus sp.]|jgi:hypothetical protein
MSGLRIHDRHNEATRRFVEAGLSDQVAAQDGGYFALPFRTLGKATSLEVSADGDSIVTRCTRSSERK